MGASLRNLKPYGEPFLGRYGVFDWIGGNSERRSAILWILNLADERHDLEAVARRSRVPRETLNEAADLLVNAGLLVVESPE